VVPGPVVPGPVVPVACVMLALAASGTVATPSGHQPGIYLVLLVFPVPGVPESWASWSARPGTLTWPLRVPGVVAPGAPRPLLPRRDRGRISPEEACSSMRRYEMMIILDPTLEEQTVQPSLDQFLSVVTTGGGSVDKIDVWGRRRLAYEIEKKPDGIYAVVDMVAEPDTVHELDRQLSLNEAVLRTKILRPEQH
jgi:small subunit ribosomal protein S6